MSTFLSNLNIHVDELVDIKTAISEAVSNAIDHAYDKDNGKVIAIGEVEGDFIHIIVQDFGKGIEDISMAMQPLYTSKPELERSGMGFTVMESFMDKVFVEAKQGEGTVVTMIKYLDTYYGR